MRLSDRKTREEPHVSLWSRVPSVVGGSLTWPVFAASMRRCDCTKKLVKDNPRSGSHCALARGWTASESTKSGCCAFDPKVEFCSVGSRPHRGVASGKPSDHISVGWGWSKIPTISAAGLSVPLLVKRSHSVASGLLRAICICGGHPMQKPAASNQGPGGRVAVLGTDSAISQGPAPNAFGFQPMSFVFPGDRDP